MTAWLLLGLAILLIFACGLFVAAEFAFVTVDRGQVDRAAAAGDASALGLQKALRTLSTQALRGPGRDHDHQPRDRLPGRAGHRGACSAAPWRTPASRAARSPRWPSPPGWC
ncbi:CNNM domain-containing protein [Nocardioides convexus]|uniref:CNNM domain-containing protein n=1 Tax=Nocardioides convexus TaxID=2712224 RepID=UPI0024186EE7|nr:CNNM domain-containing protein [Nocardioides convexus]